MEKSMVQNDFHNYLRLVSLLDNYGCQVLRDIFTARYETLENKKWEDGSHASKDFHRSHGKLVFKSSQPIQKQMLKQGDVLKWDLPLLSTVLQKINFSNGSAQTKKQHDDENKSISELTRVRNQIQHSPGKNIAHDEFMKLWQVTESNLVNLGVSLEDIEQVRTCKDLNGIEFKNPNNIVDAANVLKANKLREEGNAAVSANQLDKAIQLYADAVNLYGVPPADLGIIYSNRSSVYLKLSEGNTDSEDEVSEYCSLAMEDAKVAIELRPTWWKGYYRLGRVFQFKKEWMSAIVAFDQALALNAGNEEILNARDSCRYDQRSASIEQHLHPHHLLNQMDTRDLFETILKDRGIKGNPNDNFKVNEAFLKSKDPVKKACAFVFFAHRYRQGVDGYKQNHKMAADLFGKAADIGNAEAIFNMGQMYQKGEGVPRSVSKAVEYFEKAVKCPMNGFLTYNKLGVVAAQYALGRCYEDGVGKPTDYVKAAEWYSLASKNGSGLASNNLAFMYKDGVAVEKSLERAIQYWKLAANQGESLALENLAWEYLALGDVEEAEKFYAASMKSGNTFSILHQKKFRNAADKIRNSEEAMENFNFMNHLSEKSLLGQLMSSLCKDLTELPHGSDSSSSRSSSYLQQTNPTRVQVVLSHRLTYKMFLNEQKKHPNARIIPFTVKPLNKQNLPSQLSGLKAIKLDEMDATTDHVYSDRVLNATIMEDCVFNMYTSIHAVIKDENGDFMHCYFYNFNHKDVEIQKKLSFGSKISIISPYHRLTADLGVGIRVDDPQSVVFHSKGDDEPICRFCWAENPQNHCSRCKRAKYCSKECQQQDWKLLKHKNICVF